MNCQFTIEENCTLLFFPGCSFCEVYSFRSLWHLCCHCVNKGMSPVKIYFVLRISHFPWSVRIDIIKGSDFALFSSFCPYIYQGSNIISFFLFLVLNVYKNLSNCTFLFKETNILLSTLTFPLLKALRFIFVRLFISYLWTFSEEKFVRAKRILSSHFYCFRLWTSKCCFITLKRPHVLPWLPACRVIFVKDCRIQDVFVKDCRMQDVLRCLLCMLLLYLYRYQGCFLMKCLRNHQAPV